MKLTILGCGSSAGVPVIGCNCNVCTSKNTMNTRTRSSALIEDFETKILVDSGPEIRVQALNNNISCISGVLYTHSHYDHVNGLDDLRNFRPDKENGLPIPVYGDEITINKLEDRSSYLFQAQQLCLPWSKSFFVSRIIEYYKEFYIRNTKIIAFPQEHGKIISLGFIFNNLIAYCTDVKKIPEKALSMLKKVKLLVIECLRYDESPAHSHFALTMEFIKSINSEVAVFTHMGHEVDYDIMKAEINLYRKEHKIKTHIIIPYDGYGIEV